MITSAVFIALIGTLHFKPAISATINYEPIKITVNENFNAQPGQVSTEFQSLKPGVVHQGSNFYFKPRFNLPSYSIPHHIEALMSLIQQHHSCAKDATKVVFEKDKVMEILMPFLYPKEALSDTFMEEENNSEIAVPVPILITEESKPAIPLSFNGIPPIVDEEVKKEETVILEESTSILNEVPPKPARLELLTVPEALVLPPLSANDINIVEEVKVEEPITLTRPEPIAVDVEHKFGTPNLLVIPEAPVLPALSFNGLPSIVDEEVKKEESAIFEELTDIFPTKPAITVGLITEPIITYVEPKPSTSGLLVIPEAPVLPSLSFNGIPSFVEKEVKKEESIILEESTGESLIEVGPKLATSELEIIPEAPILPTLSANVINIIDKVNVEEPKTLPMPKPIFVDFEPKPKTPEFVVIPEAPVLPLLSFNDIRTFVEEEMKNKESIKLEESTGESQESTIIEIEPKPATPELEVVSEAPVLPPLSFNGIPDFVEEEVKKEESILLEESAGLFPELTIFEVEPKNSTPQLLVIPEAPVLPPLSLNDMSQFVGNELKKEESIIQEESQQPTMIEIEPIPATPELEIMPEAPVLPPLSANDIRIEEVKMEEPITLPVPESIVVNIEPNPVTPEFFAIPEAPMLPPLSFNGLSSGVEAEVKNEESVILEESTGVLQEPTIIEVEPKPATPELVVLTEAPVPVVEEVKSNESILLDESTLESFVDTETAESLALENNIFPVATEEIRIEMPILLEESIKMFPPNAEISSRPTLHEPEITKSYVLEEVSQPNSDHVATVKAILPPTIIRKPSNNLGVFSYAPFLSHLSSRASKTKKRVFPKPASLERFLLKKHPFRLPVTPFPKLSWNDMKSPILVNKNQFLYPTSYAHRCC